jgi:hypothetical protein
LIVNAVKPRKAVLPLWVQKLTCGVSKPDVTYGPCVDGSGLSRDRSRRSAGRSSHVFGLSVRLTGPLAIMPSADQIPVKSSHSTMLWPMWVVLITGSTGSALRAVRPFQPLHHTVAGAISSVSLRLSR